MRIMMFAVFALWAGAAQAAVIHIKPTLGAVFDSKFNDITSTAVEFRDIESVGLRPSVEPYTLRVDFSFTISDLQPGQAGFGSATFNIPLAGILNQSSAALGWNPEVGTTVDSNGPEPGGMKNKWANNGDFGSPGDLYGIIVGTDPPDFGPINVDPRRVFGQNGDEYFGSVFLEFRGHLGDRGVMAVEGNGGSVYDANNMLVADSVTVTGELKYFFVGMPEPSSAILLGLGGAILVACGRRFRR
jgi:hypothetical protein